MKHRLLLIDLLKFTGILLIVIQHDWTLHVLPVLDQIHFEANLAGIIPLNYGIIGVSLFLFASGLSLAYSNPKLGSLNDLKLFYTKRLLRIYPSYWIFGVGFTLVLYPWLLKTAFNDEAIVRIATGFQSWGAQSAEQFYGAVNGTLWFVQLIICLYLAFPVLFYCVKRHPHVTLAAAFVISMASRWYFVHETSYFNPTDWVPTCRIFEFVLGMYVVTVGWLPKWRSNFVTAHMGDIAYFMFLTNSSLLIFFKEQQLIFAVVLVLAASGMYTIDKAWRSRVETVLNKRWRIKK